MAKKPKLQQKLFIVKKYIMASSAKDAIRKERTMPVDDCWVDDEWKKGQSNTLAHAIGFTIEKDDSKEV